MKTFFTTLYLLFFTFNIVWCQEFKLIVHNNEYLNCSENYDELEQIHSTNSNASSQLFKNGKPFSGCAKITPKEGSEYFIYYVKDSYIKKVIAYFKTGEISRAFNFLNGQSHGVHVMYFKNGSKYIQEYYRNGNPIGVHRRWYENGQLAREAHFNIGIQTSEVLYNKDGSVKN